MNILSKWWHFHFSVSWIDFPWAIFDQLQIEVSHILNELEILTADDIVIDREIWNTTIFQWIEYQTLKLKVKYGMPKRKKIKT